MMFAAAFMLAAIVPSHFFGTGMTLPRDVPIPVWGTASPGERIAVTFGGKCATTLADGNGEWCAMLPPFSASSLPRDLAVGAEGSEPDVKFTDIVVGDVYLAGGQSNMQFPVYGASARQHDMKGNAIAQIADDPLLRFAAPRRSYASVPTNDIHLVWRRSCRRDLTCSLYDGTHEEGSFSAVAWYFARYVREAAKVPIAVVDVSRGGAFIEPSMPPMEVAHGKDIGLRPHGAHQAPGVMWNSMIAPMVRFPFKGVLWYQGESNKNDTNGVYLAKMSALVKGWRREFGNPELPFLYVQLAPCATGHLSIQLQQAEYARRDPKSAMVVVSDVGNFSNIHPRDKDTVGLRLALRALKRLYGFSDIEDSSPVPCSAASDANGRVTLTFDNAKWMYVLNENGSLAADFELRDGAGRWHKANILNFRDTWIWYQKRNVKNGEFSGNEIVLSSSGAVAPTAVRYLFNSPWIGSVFNEASLPLGPFEMPVTPSK